jgi:CBS domain containing-hemolysin-like protein
MSAFFSGSEAALFSLTRINLLRLEKDGRGFAVTVGRLLDRPRRLIITIVMGNEAINVIASSLFTAACVAWWPSGGQYVALAVMTPIVLLACEILPKTLALSSPEFSARLVARPISFFVWLLAPLRVVILWLLAQSQRLLGVESIRPNEPVAEADFLTWVDSGYDHGQLSRQERDWIHRILALKDKRVSEIMTPRTELFSVPVETPTAELKGLVREAGHYHLLVTGRDPDDVVGVLHAKDLLHLDTETGHELRSLLRTPTFVPELRSVAAVFDDLRTQRLQMAVVVDEYGGLAGLVTMNDVLGRLFERSEGSSLLGRPHLRPLGPGRWLVNPRWPVASFAERFGRSLPEGDYETIGGFVLAELGRLPEPGESLTWDGFTLTVTGREGTRVTGLKLEKADE